MPRGGYRPGAGRKKGAKDSKKRTVSPEVEEKKKIREMLKFDKKVKARFYQEFLARVGKGETLTLAEKKMMGQLAVELSEDLDDEQKARCRAEELSPLEYMLKVMNDPAEDKEMRARMAQAAAPYIHPRAGESGKKDEKAEKARAASQGKYAPSKPPLKMVK